MKVYEGYVCNDVDSAHWVNEGELVSIDGKEYVSVGVATGGYLRPVKCGNWRKTRHEAMRDIAKIIHDRGYAAISKANQILLDAAAEEARTRVAEPAT
jgi:hypothetical protein